MPLRDHFQPPLLDRPPWPSLATMWVGSLTAALNAILPADDYTAYAHVKSGRKTEAEIDARRRDLAAFGPPARVPLVIPDAAEVWVGEGRHEMSLAGVVLLLGPNDKVATAARATSLMRCVAYVIRGIGVVVVDVVTTNSPPQVTAWVPTHHTGGNAADKWTFPAAVGAPLPSAPLALRGGPAVTVDLEATYTAALRGLNLA